MARTRPQWIVDSWDDKAGQTIDVVDHGDLVEICSSGGEMVILFIDDATRLLAALEKWIAEKNLKHLPADLSSAVAGSCDSGTHGPSE